MTNKLSSSKLLTKRSPTGGRKTLLTDLERKLNLSEEAQYKKGVQGVRIEDYLEMVRLVVERSCAGDNACG